MGWPNETSENSDSGNQPLSSADDPFLREVSVLSRGLVSGFIKEAAESGNHIPELAGNIVFGSALGLGLTAMARGKGVVGLLGNAATFGLTGYAIKDVLSPERWSRVSWALADIDRYPGSTDTAVQTIEDELGRGSFHNALAILSGSMTAGVGMSKGTGGGGFKFGLPFGKRTDIFNEAESGLLRSQLESFSMAGRKIDAKDIAELSQFTALKHLDLSNTNVQTKHLPLIAEHVPQLESLDLTGTSVGKGNFGDQLASLLGKTKPEVSFKMLKTLNATNTKIDDKCLARLSKLAPELETLNLSGTPTGNAGLTHSSNFYNLRNLTLDRTHIDDMGLVNLMNLPELRKLSLNSTKVSDVGLGFLEKHKTLAELELVGTSVSDQSVASLRSIPNLKKLALKDTNFSGEGAELLEAKSIDCDVVRKWDGKIQSCWYVPKDMWTIQYQKAGGLFNARTLKEELQKVPHVRQIILADTKIKDETLLLLKNCHNLQNLDLSGTQISRQGLEYLQQFKSLTTLSIQKTNISADDAKVLSSIKTLERLYLPNSAKQAQRHLESALPKCEISHNEW